MARLLGGAATRRRGYRALLGARLLGGAATRRRCAACIVRSCHQRRGNETIVSVVRGGECRARREAGARHRGRLFAGGIFQPQIGIEVGAAQFDDVDLVLGQPDGVHLGRAIADRIGRVAGVKLALEFGLGAGLDLGCRRA